MVCVKRRSNRRREARLLLSPFSWRQVSFVGQVLRHTAIWGALMKRHLLLVAIVLPTFLVACSQPDVTRSMYDRLSVGMTVSQVERIIGYEPTAHTISGLVTVDSWINPDGSPIEVKYRNNELFETTQSGLE
jgi:hypothetical protein